MPVCSAARQAWQAASRVRWATGRRGWRRRTHVLVYRPLQARQVARCQVRGLACTSSGGRWCVHSWRRPVAAHTVTPDPRHAPRRRASELGGRSGARRECGSAAAPSGRALEQACGHEPRHRRTVATRQLPSSRGGCCGLQGAFGARRLAATGAECLCGCRWGAAGAGLGLLDAFQQLGCSTGTQQRQGPPNVCWHQAGRRVLQQQRQPTRHVQSRFRFIAALRGLRIGDLGTPVTKEACQTHPQQRCQR